MLKIFRLMKSEVKNNNKLDTLITLSQFIIIFGDFVGGAAYTDETEGLDPASVKREAWFDEREVGYFNPAITLLDGPDTEKWRARDRRASHLAKIKKGIVKYARKPEHIKAAVHHKEWAGRVNQGEHIQDIVRETYPDLHTNKETANQFCADMAKLGAKVYSGDHSRFVLQALHKEKPNVSLYKFAHRVRYVIYDRDIDEDQAMMKAMSIVENKITSVQADQDFCDNVCSIHRDLANLGQLGVEHMDADTLNRKHLMDQYELKTGQLGQMICLAKTFGDEWNLVVKIMTGNVKWKGKTTKKGTTVETTRKMGSSHFYTPFSNKIPRHERIRILKLFVEGELTNPEMIAECSMYVARRAVHHWIITYLQQLPARSTAAQHIADAEARRKFTGWPDVLDMYPFLGRNAWIDTWYAMAANMKKAGAAELPAGLKSELDKLIRKFDNDREDAKRHGTARPQRISQK